MAIDLPPPAPNRTVPSLFSQRMDDFLSWLVVAVPQFNSLALGSPGGMSDGTVLLPGQSFANDTDTGFWRPGANQIGFVTGGVEGMRLGAAGALLMGSANSMTGIGAARLSSQGTTGNGSQIAFGRFSADANGPEIIMAKSRGAAVDSYTTAAVADTLGRLNFYGSEGTQLYLAAGIQSQVLSVGAGDVRGSLLFNTGSAATGVVTTRLTIDATNMTSTLPFLAPNGTVGAPALTFANSPTTGLWRPAANIFAVSTAGVEAMRISAAQQVLFNLGGFGYNNGIGAGGAVTQSTSRSTGVTLNTLAGDITLFSAVGVATDTSFTVTNSGMGINDQVIVSQKSGSNKYKTYVTTKASGSFEITFSTSGVATDAPVFHFDIIRSTIT